MPAQAARRRGRRRVGAWMSRMAWITLNRAMRTLATRTVTSAMAKPTTKPVTTVDHSNVNVRCSAVDLAPGAEDLVRAPRDEPTEPDPEQARPARSRAPRTTNLRSASAPINVRRRIPIARSIPSSDRRSSASITNTLTSSRIPAATANMPTVKYSWLSESPAASARSRRSRLTGRGRADTPSSRVGRPRPPPPMCAPLRLPPRRRWRWRRSPAAVRSRLPTVADSPAMVPGATKTLYDCWRESNVQNPAMPRRGRMRSTVRADVPSSGEGQDPRAHPQIELVGEIGRHRRRAAAGGSSPRCRSPSGRRRTDAPRRSRPRAAGPAVACRPRVRVGPPPPASTSARARRRRTAPRTPAAAALIVGPSGSGTDTSSSIGPSWS